MKDARLQLRIDEDLKKKAERVAERKNRSLSFLVTKFLEDLVEQDQEAIRDDNGVRQI
jgi:antitoxin component of RelBE/YafQ-DinJ toxin-antitoxin module